MAKQDATFFESEAYHATNARSALVLMLGADWHVPGVHFAARQYISSAPKRAPPDSDSDFDPAHTKAPKAARADTRQMDRDPTADPAPLEKQSMAADAALHTAADATSAQQHAHHGQVGVGEQSGQQPILRRVTLSSCGAGACASGMRQRCAAAGARGARGVQAGASATHTTGVAAAAAGPSGAVSAPVVREVNGAMAEARDAADALLASCVGEPTAQAAQAVDPIAEEHLAAEAATAQDLARDSAPQSAATPACKFAVGAGLDVAGALAAVPRKGELSHRADQHMEEVAHAAIAMPPTTPARADRCARAGSGRSSPADPSVSTAQVAQPATEHGGAHGVSPSHRCTIDAQLAAPGVVPGDAVVKDEKGSSDCKGGHGTRLPRDAHERAHGASQNGGGGGYVELEDGTICIDD